MQEENEDLGDEQQYSKDDKCTKIKTKTKQTRPNFTKIANHINRHSHVLSVDGFLRSIQLRCGEIPGSWRDFPVKK